VKKVAFCITMYNEKDVVQHNINMIKHHYRDDSFVIVIQSDSGQTITGYDVFEVFPNLGGTINPYKLAANSVTRNYNRAFTILYEQPNEFKYVVALTGDTYISDILGLERLYTRMIREKKVAGVSQAIGQRFHATIDNPPDVVEGRLQYEGISDFMPQFFIIDGEFAFRNRVFYNIEVTNDFCTEQCLGDELSKYVGEPFSRDVFILAKNAYDYGDGIEYNKND